MKRSLRGRLVASILLFLLPTAVLAGWLLQEVFADRLLRDLDVALEEEASTLAALLEEPTGADALPSLVDRIAAETDLGVGKEIAVSRGGQVIAEAPPGAAARLRGSQNTFRLASAATVPSDSGLTVMVGVPATAAAHAARRLRALLLIGIPAALLLLAGGMWAVAGRALRPLEDAAADLGRVGIGDLATRLPVTGDDEIGHMVAALNRMLDRLAAAVAQMQRLTADAAHELRTPLAVLRAGIEVTLSRDRTAEEYRAALADALQDSERLDRLAEDLLTLARLEGLPPRPATTINLAETLHELADACEPLAEQRAIRITVDADPRLSVSGAAADLYRLFANLLDNALRHGRDGGTVTVCAVAHEGRAEVSIADDGTGIAGDEAARIFDRFFRGRAAQGAGTGLGLSIARAIAHAQDGEVTLANRPSGGCIAIVSLPLAAS